MAADMQAVSASSMSTMPQSDGSETRWFDSERLLDPGFNAEQYVADLRRYVSSILHML